MPLSIGQGRYLFPSQNATEDRSAKSYMQRLKGFSYGQRKERILACMVSNGAGTCYMATNGI